MSSDPCCAASLADKADLAAQHHTSLDFEKAAHCGGIRFTLIHAATGYPVARLRPIGRDDLVDILYWSLWKERWVPFGPFGRTAAPVKQAVRIIAEASIFWTGV